MVWPFGFAKTPLFRPTLMVRAGLRFSGAPGYPFVLSYTYYRHRKFDDAGKKFTQKINVGAAGRFFRIEAPQANFL
jgi:hypothetical protein